MWKKLKETTSGVNLTFITSIFRRRRYSKFDSDEDLNKNYDSERESNRVQWSRQPNDERTPDRTGGFTTATLHQCDNNEDLSTRGYQREGVCNARDDNQNVRFVDLENDKYGRIHHQRSGNLVDSGSHLHHRSYGSSHNYNIGGDVQDIVQGYSQRRYQKLDDADEISDADLDVDRHGELDQENEVFNSIKDVESKGKKRSSSRKKRRKKIAKRTGRVLRTSWKWIKSGIVGYAHGFVMPTTNFFVVVHTRK